MRSKPVGRRNNDTAVSKNTTLLKGLLLIIFYLLAQGTDRELCSRGKSKTKTRAHQGNVLGVAILRRCDQ